MKKQWLVATLLCGAMLLQGCTTEDGQGTQVTSQVVTTQEGRSDVLLAVTEDYGQNLIYKGPLELSEGLTVYDLLIATTEVTTDHGGSFISGINGVESVMKNSQGMRADWFYFVNGVCADVGALDYTLSAGDHVLWDYHGWQGGQQANGAIIGGYPEPFIHGYGARSGATDILFASGYEPSGKALSTYLSALGGVVNMPMNLEGYSERIADRQGPTVVIGTWQQLSQIPYLKEMNTDGEASGTYYRYHDSGLDLLNAEGQIIEQHPSGVATIMAHGSGLGDANPLWVITGTDQKAVEKAVDLMLSSENALSNYYSLAITEDGLKALPINLEE